MDFKKITEFLSSLNTEYLALHTAYENYFWSSYMGDHTHDEAFKKAQTARENFKTSELYAKKILQLKEEMQGEIVKSTALHTVENEDTKNRRGVYHKPKELSGEEQEQQEVFARLEHWEYFFRLNQTPPEVKKIKEKINILETDLQKKMAEHTEGYIDPKTKSFVSATNARMSLLLATEAEESVRKAIFVGKEKTAADFIPTYIQLVAWRNEYARSVGYTDFYAYKAETEERMTSEEIFSLFDLLTAKLTTCFAKTRKLEEESMPGLREPRNFGYMMAGDFIKQEDAYFPLEKAVQRWGQSFTAMGIDYQRAVLQLDLLERQGKYNNGFCHQPIPTHFIDEKRQNAQANFTCTAIPGQVGSGSQALDTLFHEGGHAAHFANMMQKDAILNTEYLPQSTVRAETQSMFLDTMCSSIERKMRYAKNNDGEAYPFDLYEKKIRKLHIIAGKRLLSIAAVVKFEQTVYTMPAEELTEERVLQLAKDLSLTYFDYTTPSLRILTVPHLYARNSAAYYHSYGMAELALAQWREYFYEKYDYIVDNPAVGKEMMALWQWGSAKPMQELLTMATGSPLYPDAFLKDVLLSEDAVLKRAKQRIADLEDIPFEPKINLNADVRILDGKTVIGDSELDGFTGMSQKWEKFIQDKMGKSK